MSVPVTFTPLSTITAWQIAQILQAITLKANWTFTDAEWAALPPDVQAQFTVQPAK